MPQSRSACVLTSALFGGLVQPALEGIIIRAALEEGRVGIVSRCDEGELACPQYCLEWQTGGLDDLYSVALSGTVQEIDKGVMRHPRQLVTRRGEGNIMHPSGCRELRQELGPRKLRAERSAASYVLSAVDTFHESGEDMDLVTGTTSSEDDVVRMPSKALDGRGDAALVTSNVLGDPPEIVSVEITDGNRLRPCSYCKLVFPWAPLDTSGSTVQAKDDEGGLPLSSFIVKDIGITILSTGDNTVSVGSPVDTRHE